MGRPRKINTATDDTVATNSVATVEFDAVDDKKEVVERKEIEPLDDLDEIEVVSLIPNVSYKDNKSGDLYQWDEVGHVEYMTVETLKNMWRNHKGYFRNMCLRPNDDRIISKFGLDKTYDRYELLMDSSNYKRHNIEEICKTISDMPNGLKFSVCGKIKNFVESGDLSDAVVIKALENQLHIDLFSFL